MRRLLLAGLLVASCKKSEPAPDLLQCKACNLIVVSLDTTRADRLTPYGYSRNTTPALGTLAARGVVFEQAFSVSDKTAPSHASILTGLHPLVHQVFMWQLRNQTDPMPWRLADRVETLAERLLRAGYETRAWVGGGHMSAAYGHNQGFEHYDGYGEYRSAGAYTPDGRRDEWDPAMAWLERKKPGEKPFFLLLHTYAAHDPYQPPDPYFSMYGPPYRGAIARVPNGWKHMQAYRARINLQDPADIARLSDLYDGGIRFIDDRLLAPLFSLLEKSGRMKDTVVVVLSDHGEEFMEHGGLHHDQIYDEVLHVPFIVYVPGGRPLRVPTQVTTMDLAPTVLALLGVPFASDSFQGRSLLGLLSGQGGAESPVHSVHMISKKVAPENARVRSETLRSGGWKLLHDAEKDRLALYNVRVDPAERTDVQAANSSRFDALKAELLRRIVFYKGFRVQQGLEPGSSAFTNAEVDQLKALGYVE